MYYYNKSKVKAWIKAAAKSTLIIRLDQELISDGYIILKTDQTVKAILGEMLITESVTVRDGYKQEGLPDLQKIVDGAKGDIEYKPTPLTYTSGKVQAAIFLREGIKGETHFINRNFVELLDPKLQPTYTGGEKATTPLVAKFSDDFVAVMLPIRTPDFKFIIMRS